MLTYCSDYQVRPYSEYKNRAVTKHMDKIRNQLRQIKDCSLYASDKEKLLKALKEEIESEILKNKL